MSSRIPLEELESYLWGSADLLRSSIDAGAYKQYIFPLLFFKRLCDVYDEETAKAVAEYGDELDDFTPEELHTFLIPEGAHWEDVRNTAENVGTAIQNAFHAIERENASKLSGVFGDGAWTNKNRLPDRLLKDLLEHFSSKTLSIANCPEDELGQGYEYLIKKFADDSGHTAQEFYTNRTVVHLMTEMLKPQSGESIYDPTCGSAGMLISSIAYLKSQGKEWRNVKVFGQEINNLTSAIARMNLFLHGIEDFHIVNDDTLKNPAFIEHGKLRTFNLVLANPPYSIKQWDRAAFESDKYGRNEFGTPPQSRADYAFIQHIVKSLDSDSGRCAILLPHGVLNRREEKEIRQKLIEADCIEAVIGLGRHLFYNSGLESCVLVCRMAKSEKRKGKILFVEAEKCLHKEKNQSYLLEEDIQKIMSAYLSDDDIPEFSRWVSLADLLQNEGNLNIKSYVKTESVDADTTNLEDLFQDFVDSSSYSASLLGNIGSEFTKVSPLDECNIAYSLDKENCVCVKLGDIAEEYSERIDNPSLSDYEWYIGSDCIDGFAFDIARRSSSATVTSAQKLFKAGDYLLVRRSLYGSDFRERAPRADFDGVCSADILTIREKKGMVADGFLIAILYQKKLWDFIVANSTGSLTRRIKWNQLKEFEFSLPPLDEQRKLAKLLWRIDGLEHKYRRLIDQCDELIKAQFVEMFGDPVGNPQKWNTKTIRDVSQRISDGPFGSNLKSEHYAPSGVRVIRLQNIGSGQFIDLDKAYISFEHYDKIKKYTCYAGDIVIGTLGVPNLRACIIPTDIEKAINKADCVHFIPNKHYLNTVFACSYINHPTTLSLAQDSIHGQTRPRISMGQIANLPIFLPPLPLQEEFAAFVEKVNRSKESLQTTLSSLQAVKKNILQSVFA